MDIAIVTGASSSLGLAISRRLIQLGFRVYGLGGDYTDCSLQNVNFRPMTCNLADPEAVESSARRILEKEKGVYVLINNAKFFGTRSFWEMTSEEMTRVLHINLLCPLVLARLFGESLCQLQGFVIQLGALNVESSRGGPAGAAASGGLKWMSELLFQDLRDKGVKVCQLSPEPNRGRDPRTLGRPRGKLEASIDAEAVALAVEQILQNPYGNVVTELVLRPLRTVETDREPVIQLPYPDPKPVPYTVPRELIEAEEQLEEEALDDEEQAEQRKKRKRRRGRRKEDAAAEDAEAPKAPEETPAASPAKHRSEPTQPVPASGESSPPEPSDSRSGQRRKSRRKPKPQKIEVGFHKPAPASASAPAEQPTAPASARPAEEPARTEAAPATTEPAKKAVRKAAKKAARKTTKKAVRKATKKAAKKAPRKRAAKKAASPEPGPSDD